MVQVLLFRKQASSLIFIFGVTSIHLTKHKEPPKHQRLVLSILNFNLFDFRFILNVDRLRFL